MKMRKCNLTFSRQMNAHHYTWGAGTVLWHFDKVCVVAHNGSFSLQDADNRTCNKVNIMTRTERVAVHKLLLSLQRHETYVLEVTLQEGGRTPSRPREVLENVRRKACVQSFLLRSTQRHRRCTRGSCEEEGGRAIPLSPKKSRLMQK